MSSSVTADVAGEGSEQPSTASGVTKEQDGDEKIFRSPPARDTTGRKSTVPDTPPVIRLPCCPLPYTSIKIQTMAPDKVEVIKDTDRSKVIVARLQREKVIALATEGVNVGREGPLTLVQVGTCAGTVYIFDILLNRELMLAGRLRVLLEDESVIKVMHDCSNVSAAFYFQFATSLSNVFDTQVAHFVIEEHQGRRLPAGMKLSDICLQYSDNTDKFQTYDWRTDSKLIWMAMMGNFWAMRPLTPDMIEFASGDVIVLIPDVYRHQKEYIDKHGLTQTMTQQVEEWLQVEIDDVIKEARGKKISRLVNEILVSMDAKYDQRATLFNILDADDMNALAIASFEDAEHTSKKILALKVDYILSDLGEIELRLRSEAESWEKRTNVLTHLRHYGSLPNDEIQAEAGQLLREMVNCILEHINKKYNQDTTPNMLSGTERDALLTIPYTEIHTGCYGDAIVQLYWGFMQDEIHELINMLRLVPSEFSLTDYEYKKLEYFVNNVDFVPEEVVSLAAGLLHAVCAYSAANGRYVISERRKGREAICC